VSKPQTLTQTTQLSPDTCVSGWEQGQKSKTQRLNPRRRLAQRLGRELDLRVPLGGPGPREEADTARSAHPKSEKRAQKAPLNPPKATECLSVAPQPSPRTPIDLTAYPSDLVAPRGTGCPQ
jgi:hypothetical protein